VGQAIERIIKAVEPFAYDWVHGAISDMVIGRVGKEDLGGRRDSSCEPSDGEEKTDP
jgi:hypothetical protein